MKKIGIICDERNPKAKKCAIKTGDYLENKEHKVFWEPENLSMKKEKLDFAIVFGGDGTVIRAANKVVAFEVPLIRVNFGHEGFLTNVEPSDVYKKLEKVLDSKNYIKAARSRIRASVFDSDNELVYESDGLNDIVIERSTHSVIKCSLLVDGEPTREFAGDAFIIARRTGSTAYYGSAGGKTIIREDRMGFKVAASSYRDTVDPVVRSDPVVFKIQNIEGEARLVVDGRGTIEKINRHRIEITKSEFVTIFMEIGDIERIKGD